MVLVLLLRGWQVGETRVLVTAVAAHDKDTPSDFLPLQVRKREAGSGLGSRGRGVEGGGEGGGASHGFQTKILAQGEMCVQGTRGDAPPSLGQDDVFM